MIQMELDVMKQQNPKARKGVDGENLVVVDISGMVVSDNPDDTLVTYSLGSCVGVAIYDPVAMIGGLIHCMLPLSRIEKRKAKNNPCMFVDSGMTVLLQELFDRGVKRKRVVVKVAGGSHILDAKNIFRTGEHNYTVVRRVLWKNNMLIKNEDIGGEGARTMKLEISTGRCFIKSGGITREL